MKEAEERQPEMKEEAREMVTAPRLYKPKHLYKLMASFLVWQ